MKKFSSLNQNEILANNILEKKPVSRFNRSHKQLTTFDAGKLVPIMYDEILPGDTIDLDINSLIRSITPISPTMDNAKITIHAFFVPNRLIWKNWPKFLGENSNKWMDGTLPSSLPLIKNTGTAFAGYTVNDLGSYLNLPVGVNIFGSNNENSFNRLLFNAYIKIWNDWYRDQNVQDEIVLNDSDDDLDIKNKVSNSDYSFYSNIQFGLELAPVSKFADYFTTALPSPQRGDDTSLLSSIGDLNIYYNDGSSTAESALVGRFDNLSSVMSVNELRYAIAVQQYKELDARGGTRLIEIVKNHFDVDSQDLRTQRAQFLGGVSSYINVLQISQTTPDASTPTNGNSGVGAVGAQSITTISTERTIKKSFTEHGILMVVASVRVEHSYSQGIDKFWNKKNKFDFFWPKFDNIGEQPVYVSEIFYNGTGKVESDIFGYQPAWSDYRFKQNKLNGMFSPNYNQSLKYWTYTDDYSNAPVLSDLWMRENKVNIAQTLTYQDQHQYLGIFFFNYIHSRVMKITSVPGLDKI